MATYSRQVVTTTRVEFHVPAPEPWGATYAEVLKAINAATQELRASGQIGEQESPSEDRIAVRPYDDAVVVSFEVREVAR